MLDPFVKTHACEEISNPHLDAVTTLLAGLAVTHNVAVDTPQVDHPLATSLGLQRNGPQMKRLPKAYQSATGRDPKTDFPEWNPAHCVLLSAGILVPAIRPPSVPKGTSRLRITLCANHSGEEVHGLAKELSELAQDGG